jgi:cellulose synthase/poly-beta-1,6-N-acetylglucosamine synthase-like glycosyltransferase
VLSLAGILVGSLGILAYIYVGYPLLLWLVVRVRGPRAVRAGNGQPTVTLVISAYNEASSIAAKLRNSLELDYPADRLEIVVVSDASDDATDDVVREFAGRGVRLCRQESRRGKTAGLNRFVPELQGEIVVFSDANALYDRQAIRHLVRNFDDPTIGCVTGEARYLEDSQTTASGAERLYWAYEMRLKQLETGVGSLVGADGAIYAIRRSLWRTLPEDAINDFLNPLQIVAAGWRGVYEPRAFCLEETAGDTRREYRRRVRIVSRSWRAVFQAGSVLNPLRVGFFTLSLISHKVLRWMTGAFVAAALVSGLLLAWHLSIQFRQALLLVLAAAMLSAVWRPARRGLAVGAYYLTISTASLVGIVKGTLGHVSGTWTPPRDVRTEPAAASGAPAVTAGPIVLAFVAGLVALELAVLAFSGSTAAYRAVFWASVGVVAYVYLGYPLVLAALRPVFRKAIVTGAMQPTVCLFIAANDEASIMEAKLRNSVTVEYPASHLTVVVASDGSVDGTNEIVRAFPAPNVRLMAFPERRGKIAAINDGLAQVECDVVVFSDANTFLRPGAVNALVRNFADPSVGAVSGDVILMGDRAALAGPEDLYYRYERWMQRAESEIGSMLGVDGALYAIRRELFSPPPADTILDDMAIPMSVARSRHRVVFEPEAVAHESGSSSSSEEFSRKVRVVAGAIQFLLRPESGIPPGDVQLVMALVSHKALRWLSPVFAAMAFLASLLLAAHSPVFFWVVVAELAFVALGALGAVPAVRRVTVFGLAHYFWLVQTAAFVGVFRGLLGRQPVVWRRFARASDAEVSRV